MRSPRRVARALTAAAVIVLGVAACSSTGGRPASSDSGFSAGSANTPRIKIAMVTHAPPGDTFWDLVRKGAEMAAAKDNVDLTYQGEDQAPNQANSIQSAIDSKVDGIAVTLAKPDAMKPAVSAAVAAGIPVVAFNSGFADWKTTAAIEYIGTDERGSGHSVGDRLNAAGAKHAVCVNQVQGHVDLEARCAGIAENFKGRTENLYVNGTDMSAVQATIGAKLQQDPSIDYLVTLGAPFAITAVQAVKDAGSNAKVGTFGTDEEVVKSIQSNGVQWAIDTQPYLQGYLAVDSLWLYINNKNILGGGQPVLTGPAFVDPSNVASIAEYASKGTR
ncbi:MAG: sugar transporter substrate-binding protein [Mycobacterium sp.]|nr:sugar transporter substrate-binding protein [Mycobacterium sp.]